MPKSYAIEFTLPDSSGEEAAPFLAEHAPHGWEEVNGAVSTVYRVHFPERDMAGEFSRMAMLRWPGTQFIVRAVEREDWAMAWKDFFVPVSCGDRFEVLPPWLADQADPDREHIIIEPKMAFGTGHHPTTALCLELIGDLAGRDDADSLTFLDLGTGSGILAIGLSMLGLTGLGLDTDPEAIRCAAENARTNNVDDAVLFAVGSTGCLDEARVFDVIAANILSGPLIELAPDLVRHLDTGGQIILSGILADQAARVAEAYTALGLPEPETFTRNDWAALRFTDRGS